MDTFKKQEALKPYFENSYGCAVFSSVAKGGLSIIGGAYGKGSVCKLPTEEIVGSVELVQASVGFVLGGEVYQEIIFFETEADFTRFVEGNFEFAADAKVVALTASASAKATTMGNQCIQVGLTADDTKPIGDAKRDTSTTQYYKGTKVFTVSLGGLMYQATIAGQKFTVKLN